MRNASDIFCLKELKDGDTSGTQMFSVNGRCHLTNQNRRRNLHAESSSFDYGSIPQQQISTNHSNEIDEKYDLKGIKEEMEDLELGSGGPSNRDETPKTTEPNLENVQNPKDFRKSNTKKFEEVAQSVMSRNPLTGAGVEIETHRKSKKGLFKQPKWTW
ncbi:hypothetical protein ABEB36_002999 [Hypothenemus hampei]|uniref:Uncharacterized protein n=1 Tax=Hypothenemus hampei TaxID=57062 RepID=A0ABD1F7P2_HYPHA